MRRRLEPLAIRPFGRLLGSYTLNELGDSVGLVALAVLVFDRTEAVAPTAAFFLAAKFLPALIAPALTTYLDRYALRRVLPALYVLEAAAFAGLAFFAVDDRSSWPPSRAGARRRDAGDHRAQARAAPSPPCCSHRQLGAGNALMNLGFAVSSVGGAAAA